MKAFLVYALALMALGEVSSFSRHRRSVGRTEVEEDMTVEETYAAQDAAPRAGAGSTQAFFMYIQRLDMTDALTRREPENEATPREAFPHVASRLAGTPEAGLEDNSLGEFDPENPPTTDNLDILDYFRDVPFQHWSCCMLGKLAGDKGFHCHAQFYSSALKIMDARNRAHNRRLPFHSRRGHAYGHDLMSHFRRCFLEGIETQTDFHTCCQATAIERIDFEKWRVFRTQSEVLEEEIYPEE